MPGCSSFRRACVRRRRANVKRCFRCVFDKFGCLPFSPPLEFATGMPSRVRIRTRSASNSATIPSALKTAGGSLVAAEDDGRHRIQGPFMRVNRFPVGRTHRCMPPAPSLSDTAQPRALSVSPKPCIPPIRTSQAPTTPALRSATCPSSPGHFSSKVMLWSAMRKLWSAVVAILLLTGCSQANDSVSSSGDSNAKNPAAGTIYALNLGRSSGVLSPTLASQSPSPAVQMTLGAYLGEDGSVWTYNSVAGVNSASKVKDLPRFKMLNGDGVTLFGVTESGTVMEIQGVRTKSLDGQPDPPDAIGELKLTKPTTIPNLSNIQSVEIGARQVYALDAEGVIWGWGLNVSGVLGPESIGTTVVVPRKVPGLPPAKSFAFGVRPMILATDGTVWEWGKGKAGPVRLESLPNISAISSTVQQGRSYALSSDGDLYTWGDEARPPNKFSTLSTKPKALSLADANIFVIDDNGALWAAGNVSDDLGSPGAFVKLEGMTGVLDAMPAGAGLLIATDRAPSVPSSTK